MEDDEQFGFLTAELLEDEGEFEITTEQDPQEALERLGADPGQFDCVVSDYDMPGMTGLDLLEAVRGRGLELPFILFTGKGSEEIASQAISAGVTDYLQKGGGKDRFRLLGNRVENAVGQHRTEAQLHAQERLSERIVMATPIAIVVHDVNGDVMLSNDRATELLGTEIADLNGSNYEDAPWSLYDTSGTYVTADRLPYRRVVETGLKLRNEQYIVRTGDGGEQHILVHGAPLRDEQGEIEGAIIPFEAYSEAALSDRS